jgi:iron-sulfur cluster assembly protein
MAVASVETMEETAFVTMTDIAAVKLLAFMNEKGLADTHALRVFVSGGGCSGLQYGMAFDANPRPADVVFEQHGLRVVVDPKSLQYLAGANIDYVDGPTGGGFNIENPNAVSTCGCGQSSSSCEDAENEGGGCSGCR